jgi:hypothetical protein
MARMKQLSVFLPNAPGELEKLCQHLKAASLNILAISIQNAKNYVEELLRARERSGRRMVLEASYRGVLKESSETSIIRLVVADPEQAERVLRDAGYALDIEPVIGVVLANRPSVLGEVAGKFAQASINIDYVYGSVMDDAEASIFVIHVQDIDRGVALCEDWQKGR